MEAKDLLGGAAVLPNQVMREEDGSLFTNSTRISSSLLLVKTVEQDDDINYKQPQIDRDGIVHIIDNNNNDNNHNDTVHVVEVYADEYYVNENEVDNTFFKDSFVATGEDLNNIFIIPTSKHAHRTRMTPVVLMKIKTTHGVLLTCHLIASYDSGSTGILIKDLSLPLGAKPIITEHATVLTTK